MKDIDKEIIPEDLEKEEKDISNDETTYKSSQEQNFIYFFNSIFFSEFDTIFNNI